MGEDLVDVSFFNVSDFDTLRPYMRQSGNDVLIETFSADFSGTASPNEVIILRNISLNDLSGANFVFNNSATAVTASATNGNDFVLFGGQGNDTLTGLNGDDQLNGGSGDDMLSAGFGVNLLRGGSGADTYIMAARGQQTQNIEDFVQGEDRVDVRILNVSDFETLRPYMSQSGSDVLIQTFFNDFDGRTPNEVIRVRNVSLDDLTAADFVFYDVNADLTVTASNGNDYVLFGGQGNDIITGQGGRDTLNGGLGNDSLTGGSDNDTLIGGAGADRLDGGTGQDTASYISSTTAVTIDINNLGANAGDAAGDTYISIEILAGSAFDDTLTLGGSVTSVQGLAGNDIITGSLAADSLIGGEGNDTLVGGAGADVLDGGEGRDRASYISSTSGVTVNLIDTSISTGDAIGDSFISIEELFGSVFDDVLTSGNDDNDLQGLAGNDILVGANGQDRLFGGDGEDRLLGGRDNDDLFGQGGDDTFVIRAGAGIDRIFDFASGEDVIEFEGGPGALADLTIVQVGANTEITSVNGVTILLGITASSLTAADFTFVNPLPGPSGTAVTNDLTTGRDDFVGTIDDNTINGFAGDDTIRGGIGDDILNGGDGNDTLFGGLGADVLNGGDGVDRAFYTEAATGVTANFIDPSLNTGEAAGDTYISIETISGSDFDDFITSGNDDNDLLGQGGNDILVGAGGADRLFGGEGDDRLLGGTGDDDMFGQEGRDTYVIRADAGNDRIFDFEQGEDKIEFEGGPASFTDLVIAQSGANVVITSSNGVTTIIGATASDFDASDFAFMNPAVSAAPAAKPVDDDGAEIVDDFDLVITQPDAVTTELMAMGGQGEAMALGAKVDAYGGQFDDGYDSFGEFVDDMTWNMM